MTPETPHSAAAEEPTFGDLLRFFWGRRVRLFKVFCFVAGAGFVGIVAWKLFARSNVEGVVTLTFKGIARHEYPSGRKFSVEDLRGPEVLTRALNQAGLQGEKLDLEKVYGGIEIVPVIPPEIQARWRKQDQNGLRREEFLPNEFRITVHAKNLSNDQRINFLYALVKAYQDQIRIEQGVASRRVTQFSTLKADELMKAYNFWDLPTLFRRNAETFREQLAEVIKESSDFRDSQILLTFRDVQSGLTVWAQARLEALTALTYREHLVKDRDLVMSRLQERRRDLDIQIRQASSEAAEMTRLLESADRPRPTLAGTLSPKEGSPLVDATVLERLVKSDYVGPVVRRISDLLGTQKKLEAWRERVDAELVILAKATDLGDRPLPPGYSAVLEETQKDFAQAIASYNQALDRYLQATVQNYVVLRDGPARTTSGPSTALLLAALVAVAAVLAFLSVLFVREFRGP